MSTQKPTALVIGASRGIGKGLLSKLEAAGYETYGTVRSFNSTDGSTGTTDDATIKGNLLKADLTNSASLAAGASALSQTLKSNSAGAEPALDLLVISGATAGDEPYLTLTEERHLDFYNTNVAGPLRAIQAFLPLLRAGTARHILILSSLAGNTQFRVQRALSLPKEDRLPLSVGPYGATKAALNMFGAGLYGELDNEGFKITLVHPGLVDSDMAQAMISRLRAHAEKTGEEVALEIISVEESAGGIVKVIQEVAKVAGPDLRLVNWKGQALPW
ncbi:hypothetical protein V8E36_007101 [Tilletia maclaganii]